MASRTIAGWSWTVRPYTSGLTMLPWTMLKTTVQIAMITMMVGSPSSTAIEKRRPGRDEPADVRNEAQEERQDRDRDGERQPQDGHDQVLDTAPTAETTAVPPM